MRSASRDHGRIIRGSFVELRGRPWLVEESRGEGSELQTLCLSCISDDAQGERLEVPWDAEIGGSCSARMSFDRRSPPAGEGMARQCHGNAGSYWARP